MMFGCFPRVPGTGCEWVNLRDFATQYNRQNNKAYCRVECLDITERQDKAPEVRLECDGEIPIVMEHKSVVWPSNYFKQHRHIHYMMESAARALSGIRNDSAYELAVLEKDILALSRREIGSLIRDIVAVIRSDERQSLSRTTPIPWRLSPLPTEDEDAHRKGVRVSVSSGWITNLSQFGNRSEVMAGYSKQFECEAVKASEKFSRYDDCLKFLLVHFHGEGVDSPSDDEVMSVVRTARIPKSIDQVWVAEKVWIDLHRDAVSWNRVI